MRYILFCSLCVIYFHSGGCQSNPKNSQTIDIFQATINKFRQNTTDSMQIIGFPSVKDSTLYVKDLFNLLNKELSTKIFGHDSKYCDFSFRTKSYDLTVHEIILSNPPTRIDQKIFKPRTEVPLQMQLKQFGNRILLFSYSPVKFNDHTKQAIKNIEDLYEEFLKKAQ